MARYRRIRTDWHVHPKTAGLSPLARDLVVQALSANIAGVLERSIGGMKHRAGHGVTAAGVEMAIAELVERRMALWIRDSETLWIIEAADEQAQNEKAWMSVAAVFNESPIELRKQAARRYPGIGIIVPDTVSYSVCDTVFPQEQEQEQEQEQTYSRKTPASPGVCEHVFSCLTDAMRQLNPKARGPRDTLTNRKRIADATRAHDLTTDDWTHVIRRQLENVRHDKRLWPFLSLETLCRKRGETIGRRLAEASEETPEERYARVQRENEELEREWTKRSD